MPVLTTNTSGAAPPVVGVLGGGQLGRMMSNAAHRLGLQVLVLDPLGADSPAGQTGLKAVAGSFTKEEDIAKLAEQCDVLTVEIEHVNAAFLQQLQDKKEANLQGVHPAPATIALIQDKYQQKQFFTQVEGVDVAPYEIVTSLQGARQVGDRFGYPYMLKSRRLAYDGKGNAVVKSEKDLVDAFEKLGAKLLAKESADVDLKQLAEEEAKLYAEKWVPFVKELAVMVVKGAEGDVRAYPVVETTQRDSICDTVLAPAQIPEDVAKRAGELAQAAVAQLDGRGIYGVELFLTATGEVLLNEIAPRPHNSGHYTIEACETDQFEQHLRAITGLPLGSCALRVPAALMVNVLGDATSSEDVSFSLLRNSLSIPGAAAHFYGKAGVRPGRKLGHVTITAPNVEELAKRATALSPEAAKNSGLLKHERKPLVGIVMGSDSDLPSMAAAADMLEKFGVPYELTIVSAHRTPARMYEYAQSAAGRGLKVIIAGAGGAAHLPGMIAALTPLPVVGVPVKTSTLNGEDSLLSIVQMPRGVPVATVAIGNSTNAGLLAVRILGAGDSSLIEAMATFLDTQKREVDDKIEKMATSGWKEYLQKMKKH
ncbi:phosphoribosylaminoimidazole carboxylase [Phytophthora cactorum]|nr:phosphoribosylaminoimidazole carboxylase [Phytophthora cactorum]